MKSEQCESPPQKRSTDQRLGLMLETPTLHCTLHCLDVIHSPPAPRFQHLSAFFTVSQIQ